MVYPAPQIPVVQQNCACMPRRARMWWGWRKVGSEDDRTITSSRHQAASAHKVKAAGCQRPQSQGSLAAETESAHLLVVRHGWRHLQQEHVIHLRAGEAAVWERHQRCCEDGVTLGCFG